jgi:hypothetical protein
LKTTTIEREIKRTQTGHQGEDIDILISNARKQIEELEELL